MSPVLPRWSGLKFLCIILQQISMSCFEIRSRAESSCRSLAAAQLAADGMSIPEQLTASTIAPPHLVADQYRCLNSLCCPRSPRRGAAAGARRMDRAAQRVLEQYFEREVERS